ncbi:unnamed protein product [Phytophthora fragariaefolia]|uniref:Unnamed protein product n=1 Tax=Phytophthora fragariaefolia TaxID=1490495 RepID=A0A9W6XCZ3_9STRA|nr:unnamed protein product [Phytophthora fragariaefolia]
MLNRLRAVPGVLWTHIVPEIEKAAEYGRLGVVNMLIKCRKNLAISMVIGNSPIETTKFILDRCNVACVDLTIGLMWAKISNRIDVVKLIAEHSEVVSCKAYWATEILQIWFCVAAKEGSIEMVDALIHSPATQIHDALESAVLAKQLEVVERLLKVGSENQIGFLEYERSKPNRWTETNTIDTRQALQIAVGNNDFSMVELLLEHSSQAAIAKFC